MRAEQKKNKFIRLNVVEDGKTVTKIDLPAKVFKKVSWSEQMSKAELLKVLWSNVYVITDKEAEEELQHKGVI